MYIYVHLIGKIPNNWEFIRLGLFLLQDTAGSVASLEYIKYSLDLGKNNPNTQESCQKVAVNWQKLPDQHRNS